MEKRKESKPILYEMMYILDPELGEDGIERMNGAIRERITGGGGTIDKDQPWGIRKLAYEIKNRQEGYYHVLEFRAPQALPQSLAAFIRTQTGILRHLIIKVPKAKILQEQRDAAAAAKVRERPKPEEEPREAPPAETAEPSAVELSTVEVPSTEETPAPAPGPSEEIIKTREAQVEHESAAEMAGEEAAAAGEPEEAPPDVPAS